MTVLFTFNIFQNLSDDHIFISKKELFKNLTNNKNISFIFHITYLYQIMRQKTKIE